MQPTQRLLSVDALRGLTIAGMILVNNAGGRESYAFLRHSVWNGLTPCDLVFPFFLFIVGVSAYLSLQKSSFRPSVAMGKKILRRTLLILCIGWALGVFDLLCEGDFQPWLHLRIPGVLQRIALCYGAVACMALYVPHRRLKYVAGGLLVGYALLLLAGHGYAPDATNILCRIDRSLLGEAHLYRKSPIDPEGLASTLPAIAHTLIGFLSARAVMRKEVASEGLESTVLRLFALGFVLMAVGYLLSEALPLNKRIWSPTYVGVTCGLALQLWAWLTLVIDLRGQERAVRPFIMIGMNPLALYVLSEVLAVVLSTTGLKSMAYDALCRVVPAGSPASAVYALLYTLLLSAIGYLLYRKKIFVKI